MKVVERSNIDVKRWNELVNSTPDSSMFSLSWYLDATAEHWCIVVDSDYSKGMALPYSKRVGLEILYTPIFVRYVEWFGELVDPNTLIELIEKRFSVVDIACKYPTFGNKNEGFVYQRIGKEDERIIGSQAKRSIKKALKENLKIQVNSVPDGVFSVVKDELKDKHAGINEVSLKALGVLFESAREEGSIVVFNVVNSELEGGIVCIKNKDTLLYLKGSVDEGTKKAGGMYLALDAAINYAKENNLHFDFGGSRIEGVMKFNHNLGGKDTVYHAYTLNNGPFWFKLARRLKNKWIKK